MTSQSRFGILVGAVLLLACGLVVTELQQDNTPVDVAIPDPVASHHHARTVGQVGEVVQFTPRQPTPAPREVARSPVPTPRPTPRPEPRPRYASDERTTEAVNVLLAAVREPVPDGRPVFVEMDANELREHLNVSPTPTPAPAPVTRRYTSYTVQSGDNLTKIAQRSMGDGSASAVNQLFEFNRNVMDDPNHIVVGMTLRVPVTEGR